MLINSLPNENRGIVHVRTPFRVSFFGGGTDFPSFFNSYRGKTIGTTIDKYSYVSLNSLERLLEKKIKLSYSKLELVNSPDELEHPIVKCILSEGRAQWANQFIDIHSFADLPSGSGVGSSSSFTVGMLQALSTLQGVYQSPNHLAVEAINIERYKLNECGGWQDQIFAAYGGFNQIDFKNNSFSVTPIVMDNEVRRELEQSFLFYFTNSQRSSALIQEQTFSQTNLCSKYDFLKEMVALADEAISCLHSKKPAKEIIREFGELLDASWKLKRNLCGAISNEQINDCYQSAIKLGAYGGKVSGAGGGGFMFFLVPQEKHEAVRKGLRCKNVKEVKVSFSSEGSQVIFYAN